MFAQKGGRTTTSNRTDMADLKARAQSSTARCALEHHVFWPLSR